jgi:hypothetical protein
VLAEKGTETVKLGSTTSEETSFTALGQSRRQGRSVAFGSWQKEEPTMRTKIRSQLSVYSQRVVDWQCHCVRHQLSAPRSGARMPVHSYPRCLSSHGTKTFLDSADANDVELIFVPPGATERLQLMDRRVFRELKAWARAEFACRIWRRRTADVN